MVAWATAVSGAGFRACIQPVILFVSKARARASGPRVRWCSPQAESPLTAPHRLPPSPTPSVLVTGGCGYIGAHVAAALLTHTPWRVRLVDNFANSGPGVRDAIVAAVAAQAPDAEARLGLHACDLRDPATLDALPPVDAVVHMAALKSVPASVADPVSYYDNNLRGLVNVLSWAQRRDCGAVVYSSSCSVYGDVAAAAGPDPARRTVTEATPMGTPLSPYAHTKQLNESILRLYPGARRMILRYFNPVGAHASGLLGDRPDGSAVSSLAAALCRAAAAETPFTIHGDDYDTRDGTCVRDYVHVCDIAEAHVEALRWAMRAEDGPALDVVNLGSAEGHTVREAVAAFERATGETLDVRTGPRRPGDIAAIENGSRKALRTLGWAPKRTLDEMMASAWAWHERLVGAEVA